MEQGVEANEFYFGPFSVCTVAHEGNDTGEAGHGDGDLSKDGEDVDVVHGGRL